jgi:predicted GNAT family acetyltransferase
VSTIVRDNAGELRYELHVDSSLAGEIRYRREPGARVLVHVEIEPRLEGRGLGSLLVEGALEDLRARGLRVVPHAPFVLDFIRRRPEYADLVSSDPAVSD